MKKISLASVLVCFVAIVHASSLLGENSNGNLLHPARSDCEPATAAAVLKTKNIRATLLNGSLSKNPIFTHHPAL